MTTEQVPRSCDELTGDHARTASHGLVGDHAAASDAPVSGAARPAIELTDLPDGRTLFTVASIRRLLSNRYLQAVQRFQSPQRLESARGPARRSAPVGRDSRLN